MAGLRVVGLWPWFCRRLRARALRPLRRGSATAPRPDEVELAQTVAGLVFPHPIGVAAGLDKDATATAGLFALGFAFVEVGTVTPRPQPGNPRPRLFRLPEARALINRLGFNNAGAAAMAARLAQLRFRPGAVGVNLGKNRDTPLEDAVSDYLAAATTLAPHADYLVVNASSPNTPGLRDLQEPDRLAALLTALRAATAKPLFLKVAPDLAPAAIDAVVDTAIACGANGLLATNTTILRPPPVSATAPTGGLSGAPLAPLATEVIRRAALRASGRLPIIGVGGVFSAEDVYAKMRAGASLVQVYTGLIYQGPALVRRLLQGLRQLLARDGLHAVGDLVGRSAASQSPSENQNLKL
jgi:dihydroorotate dehydrogenase